MIQKCNALSSRTYQYNLWHGKPSFPCVACNRSRPYNRCRVGERVARHLWWCRQPTYFGDPGTVDMGVCTFHGINDVLRTTSFRYIPDCIKQRDGWAVLNADPAVSALLFSLATSISHLCSHHVLIRWCSYISRPSDGSSSSLHPAFHYPCSAQRTKTDIYRCLTSPLSVPSTCNAPLTASTF